MEKASNQVKKVVLSILAVGTAYGIYSNWPKGNEKFSVKFNRSIPAVAPQSGHDHSASVSSVQPGQSFHTGSGATHSTPKQ